MQKANSYTDMLNAMPAKIRNRFLSLAKFTYETVQEYQESHGIPTVSYTHLTLPTSDLV